MLDELLCLTISRHVEEGWYTPVRSISAESRILNLVLRLDDGRLVYGDRMGGLWSWQITRRYVEDKEATGSDSRMSTSIVWECHLWLEADWI